MKYSTFGILIGLFICFLTLLISANIISIKIYKPVQIYVNQNNKYLLFSDEKDFNFFKNKKTFQAIISGTNQNITLYKQGFINSSKNDELKNIIYFSANSFNFKDGWSSVFLYERSETFLKHYLQI